jgi:hypothetical protein
MATHTSLDRAGTEFIYRDADSQVLLTAPHNKAVLRDGAYKPRDNNVGVLATEAARSAGVCALVPATPGDEDGNWSAGSRFRRLLLRVAADSCVLDVHGMSDVHGFDLVIGTAGGSSPSWLVELLEQQASLRSMRFDVRHTGALSAGTKTITALDIASGGRAQLGIGAGWFELEHDSQQHEADREGDGEHRTATRRRGGRRHRGGVGRRGPRRARAHLRGPAPTAEGS